MIRKNIFMRCEPLDYLAELEKLAVKVCKDVAEIQQEFESKTFELEKVGYTKEIAAQTAYMQIVGAYRAQSRSGAKTFEGYFIGVTSKRNVNQTVYKQATEALDEFKAELENTLKKLQISHPDDWQAFAIKKGLIIEDDETEELQWFAKAVEAGMLNEKGEFLYTADLINSDAQKWLVDKKEVIDPEKWEKTAYGLFKMAGTNEVKIGVLYIRNPDEFNPILFRVYKFRAGCSKPDNKVLSMSGTKVTKLDVCTGIDISFVEFQNMINEIAPDCLYTFNDLYNLDEKKAEFKQGVPRIAVTMASISGVSILEGTQKNTGEPYTIDFVEVTDVFSPEFDNVSMTVDKLNNNLFEGAIGIVVYSAYVKKDGGVGGQIFGFIPDDRICSVPSQDIEEITPDDEEEESSNKWE